MVAPGGMGTLDELFEVLTLKQTGKVQTDLPVVLFGKKYWKGIINWEAIAEFGVISESDFDDLFFADTGGYTSLRKKKREGFLWGCQLCFLC